MLKNESDLYPYSVSDLSLRDAIVISPHPDDESIGCGGSIVKHIKAGSKVKVIFLTDGDKGDFRGRYGGEYRKLRRESSHKAMEILGVKDYEFWGYGDRCLQQSAMEIGDRLIHVINAFSPSVVYVPSPLEAHPDHRSSFNAVWMLRQEIRCDLAVYEVLMALYPNILVDITDEMEQKRRAIESYYTELCYNDYLTKVEGLNRFRTATLPENIRYAEAFVLLERGCPDSLSLEILKIAVK